jgi:uncharacterized hydrophobic protein (TIGR00271 family)
MAAANEGSLTVMTIESATGSHAIELGERELQDVLKGAGVAKKRDIETRVLQADNQLEAIVSVAGQFDIVAVGANNLKHFSRLADSIAQATIVIFRKAAPIRPWRSRNRLIDLVPRLAPSDYADLVQNLRTGSRWSTDFRIMLGLAVGIASLGLLLNSAAVIIGSMLLAPLMTPMVGAGLSLVQGNARLAGTCARSVGRGVLMGVAISFLIGLALPGDELTPELTARGSPNVLDLLIALFSAAAGAYALARPTLAGSIAGVAIATALVPPLCTVGISLSAGQFDNAVGAALLFITNLFAIVLAAAGMFRWMGLGESVDPVQHSKWVRRVSVAMLLATIALTIPLSEGLIHRLRKGVSQTAAAPLSASTYEAVQQHIDRSPGVSIVLAVRRPSSLERQTDYRIVVASDDPLPRSFAAAITRIIRTQMKDDSLRVEVISLPQNWMADDE